jgi:hypothetical protein
MQCVFTGAKLVGIRHGLRVDYVQMPAQVSAACTTPWNANSKTARFYPVFTGACGNAVRMRDAEFDGAEAARKYGRDMLARFTQ